MRISVLGLGYVGTVCAACMASERHHVVGVDVNPDKVDAINAGQTLLVEPGVAERVRAAVARGALRATTSVDEAIAESEVSLICVGTASRPNGSLDLDQVERVSEQIGAALRSKAEPHLVIVRSTVLPGTTEEVVAPIVRARSGRESDEALGFCSVPEFLREGSSVDDFYHPPKIVVGESQPAWGDLALQLFRGIEAPVIRTSLRVAEMVKYADNAFHALKISFANEIGNLAREMGVDGRDVMSVFCADAKLNLSAAYLKPGFAFGGSCLPKDLRALTHHARQLDVASPVLSAVLDSNALQVQRLVRRVQSLHPRGIAFLGMSFKSGTDDLRESPLVEAIETLIGKGYAISIVDPDVSTSRLIGSNRRYIEERIPHLSSLLRDDLDAALADAELIVVGHATEHFRAALAGLRPDQYVIDLVGIAGPSDTRARYEGICW